MTEIKDNLATSIGGFFTDLGNNLSDWFSGLRDNLRNWFSDVGDWFTNLGNSISDKWTEWKEKRAEDKAEKEREKQKDEDSRSNAESKIKDKSSEINNNIAEKFNSFYTLKDFFINFWETIENSDNNVPDFSITLPAFLGGQTVQALDLTFYNKYRNYIHGLIIGLCYFSVLRRIFKRIPTIIHN